ncbi:MAG: hypothetical protein PUF50_06940 [Erysipelotrichaceae bacterium]|nr:hypothetical protein [Erysipelotrichaceae bacterium]
MNIETIQWLFFSGRCSEYDLDVFQKYGYLDLNEKNRLLQMKQQ